jgi:hypothetical protein
MFNHEYIHIYNSFFSAFNLENASSPDKMGGCVYLFEHNLLYQSWSFEMTALRSFSSFIIKRHCVLVAATAENRVSQRQDVAKGCSKVSC